MKSKNNPQHPGLYLNSIYRGLGITKAVMAAKRICLAQLCGSSRKASLGSLPIWRLGLARLRTFPLVNGSRCRRHSTRIRWSMSRKQAEYGTCEHCRQKFHKHRAWARFCGTSCSDKARRKRAAHPIALPSMPGDHLEGATGCLPRKQREESDDYPEVVAVLNPTLRVIRGKCGCNG